MKETLKLGVLASGRGSNLQALIDAAYFEEIGAEIMVVISDNPDAKALERARNADIPAVCIECKKYRTKLTPDIEKTYVETLKSYNVDLVVLAGFMRVLHDPFLKAFPGRIINIHPSLLPAFPGLNAQKQALEYGVKYSGCTVHFVDRTVDGGKIIKQRVVPVLPCDTEELLSARILDEEHKLLPEAVEYLRNHYFTEETGER